MAAKTSRKPGSAKKAARPKPYVVPRGKPHVRTEANERVIRALVRANAEVAHDIIAEALACSVDTLQRHYDDLIPHVGPGRPDHEPTAASRLMVEQHKALGLKHTEIAALLKIEKTSLEKHYRAELDTAKARTVGMVGSIMVARALSKTDKDAQRAGEFYLERMGGGRWQPRSKLGVGLLDPGDDDAPALVNGARQLERGDARKVALLLHMAQARPAVVVSNDAAADDAEPSR